MLHIKHRLTPEKAVFILSFLTVSCSFNFELTSQKTALENQIMGNYKELEDDLLVTNFERKSESTSKLSSEKSSGSGLLLRAQKNREFNSDDIKELKDNAIIGELSDGQIALLPKSLGGVSNASPEQLKLAEALIYEENRDRAVIWKISSASSIKLNDKEEANIRINFARDLFEKSPEGHWFFIGNRWTVKQQ